MIYEQMWGEIIAAYLFLAGLGAGAYVMAALLKWIKPEAVRMRRAALIIAPVVVAIGLVLLMVDAEAGFQHPLRFFHLIDNLNSIMAWGVVFLALFMVLSIITLILEFVKVRIPKILWYLGVILSVCVACYTGALLGACITYPLWNNGVLPVLFPVSALSAGMAIVLLVGALFFRDEFAELRGLKMFHFVLPIIEIVLIIITLAITATNSQAGLESVMGLISGDWAVAFWVLLVAVGLVVPMVIESYSLFIAPPEFEESSKGRWTGVLSELCVLIGGFMLRYLIVMAALPLDFVA